MKGALKNKEEGKNNSGMVKEKDEKEKQVKDTREERK